MNIQRVMKLTVNIQSMQRNTHKQLKFSDMTIRLLPMTPLLWILIPCFVHKLLISVKLCKWEAKAEGVEAGWPQSMMMWRWEMLYGEGGGWRNRKMLSIWPMYHGNHSYILLLHFVKCQIYLPDNLFLIFCRRINEVLWGKQCLGVGIDLIFIELVNLQQRIKKPASHQCYRRVLAFKNFIAPLTPRGHIVQCLYMQ